MAVTDILPAADPQAIRSEMQDLKRHLDAHNKGELKLSPADYTRYVRRTMVLISQLNKTTAGPKKTPVAKKIKALATNPDSLDDI